MEREDYQRIKRILNACLEIPGERRGDFARAACEGDAVLLAEIESLLDSHANLKDFLVVPASDKTQEELPTGTPVGLYEIREPIAEGGMGTVYRAVRTADFEKEVAIKVVKRGMDSNFILQRFRHERQILAALDHPNIARLLDGGATGDGRPYLVMEYIAGQPITEFCQQRELRTRERLELFRAVCSAVYYAHQNLVVHRDLKPRNILVTDSGVPKLLDFGIAKLLEPEADATVTSMRLMTPECASPEQVRGEPITTATDIYSLGVLLYQLLTNQPPYQFRTRTVEEIRRIVCEADPPKPSTVADLSEDLDNIVLKAMHKEPARRYSSAEQLSEDVGRYLAGMPVSARKDTFRYRASKFIRRHKVGTAASVIVLLSLVGGVSATLWEAHIARLERARAERRFAEMRRLAGSVIFDLEDRLLKLPGTTEVRKELVTTSVGYLDELAKEASGDAGLQRELAEAYLRVGNIQGGANQSLGDVNGAVTTWSKAEQIARQLLVQNRSTDALRLLVRAIRYKAWACERTGNPGQGERWSEEALGLARDLVARSKGSDEAESELAAILLTAADFVSGERQIAYRTEAVSLYERLLAGKPSDATRQRNLALAEKYLAGGLLFHGDADRAYSHLKRVDGLDEPRAKQAPNDPVAKLDWVIDLSQWAEYYKLKKNIRTAVEFTQKSLALTREIAAANPKDTWAQERLAYFLGQLGTLQLEYSPAEALASYKQALALGRDKDDLAVLLHGAAMADSKLGNVRAACANYAQATRLYRELLQGPLRQYFAARAAVAEAAYAQCGPVNPASTSGSEP